MGLLVEGAQATLIRPIVDQLPAIDGYLAYYSYSSVARLILLIASVSAAVCLGGASLLALAILNIFSLYFNMLYLNPMNYSLLCDVRAEFFAPTYRTAEVMASLLAIRELIRARLQK